MDAKPQTTPITVESLRTLFADVLNGHDADALLPYWAEDVVEEFPTGTVRGREEVRAYFAATFAAIPDFHIEVKDIAQNGDVFFVRWHMTGTFSGTPWMGLDPTGTRIALDGIDCFTFRDGLVVHNKVIYDQFSFARQIGLLPEDGTAMDRATKTAFNTVTRLRRMLGRAAA